MPRSGAVLMRCTARRIATGVQQLRLRRVRAGTVAHPAARACRHCPSGDPEPREGRLRSEQVAVPSGCRQLLPYGR